jgi:hypothetical protein
VQAGFLEAFAALQPDLAVTAAYGNMLPAAFLALPAHGTLNIHPSLLPAYRGAAPVQRALQVRARPVVAGEGHFSPSSAHTNKGAQPTLASVLPPPPPPRAGWRGDHRRERGLHCAGL